MLQILVLSYRNAVFFNGSQISDFAEALKAEAMLRSAAKEVGA
jgi:hypothetical protein